jgi:ABC-type multidrug transport system fused ATPase/permease subunit
MAQVISQKARPRQHKVTLGQLRRILSYLRPYWWIEAEVFVCMAIGVALTLVNPLVIKVLIDNVIVDKNIGLLHIIMIALVALYLIRALFNVVTAYLFNFVGQRVLFDIRSQLFQRLERLHMGFFHRMKTGEMVSRINNDVESLQSIVTTTFVDLITDLITVIGILAVVLYLDWRLTLVSLSVFPLFILSMSYFSRQVRSRSRLVREKVADILHFFHETITGMKLVQSFVQEKFEARRFLRKGKEMINLRIGLGFFGSLTNSSAGFFVALGPALVLWYGGYRVMSGALTIGGLVAFYAYIGDLFSPIFRLAQLNVTVQTALASIERIFEFLDIEPRIQDAPDAVVLSEVRGDVAFENISFSYQPGEPILEDISFRVRQGETVAIVGPSGVGKTTIINLVCRFYDPLSGAVRLDGVDIRRIKVTNLRKQIGIVSQETFLFNSSILENLRYGSRRSTNEEVVDAAGKANINEFIESLPDGYETMVGDRGVRLSGGERQRLAIARAILKDPKILILDEATSSLDSKSEALIQKALEPLTKDRTTITIAHRLSTVVNAGTILVLNKCRIVERGTHRELLERGGLYKTLWDEQVKSKENV